MKTNPQGIKYKSLSDCGIDATTTRLPSGAQYVTPAQPDTVDSALGAFLSHPRCREQLESALCTEPPSAQPLNGQPAIG